MDSFDELIKLLNTSESKCKFNETLTAYLSHKSVPQSINENTKLTNQILSFLTSLFPLISDDSQRNKQIVTNALNKLQIKNNNITNDDFASVFNDKLLEFKASKFGSNYVNMDWQVSVLDRKNDNSNLSKADKVEITTKINSFNSNEQKYSSHVIKMNYNEFSEIMANFKKIDEQLHMFKS